VKGLLQGLLGRLVARQDRLTRELSAGDDRLLDELVAEGQALEDQGRPAEALARYRRAIAERPRSVRAHLNAGNAFRLLKDEAAAVAMYRRAVELDAGSAPAHFNLGTALHARREFVDAEREFRAALHLRPQWAEACVGLACALEETGAAEEAAAAYSRALAIEPAHAGAAANLSALQAANQDTEAARRTLSDSLRLSPDHPLLLKRLAILELDEGRLTESLRIQRAVIAQNPQDFSAWSTYLFNLSYVPGLSAEENLAEHARFGQLLEAVTTVRSLPAAADRDADRRLRVGYVSGDFNRHAMASFTRPVIRCRDRSAFEVICYHTLHNEDQVTVAIRELADHWRNVADIDDEAFADQVVADRIDILVDLSGHSHGNRLGVFARKPAPVQLSWIGYQNTTGLSRIDYRVCDSYTDPPGVAERWHTETPVRLPGSQLCYEQQLTALPAPSVLPRLASGQWTFGSFNNYRKLNDQVVSAWADLLRSIDGSRLRLFTFESRESAERVIGALIDRGIDRARLDWIPRAPPEQYFDSFAGVDVALDPFPYNGATTTCDALLMGVPVLAVAGSRSIARGGISLLNTIGMRDWIAPSDTELAAVAQRQLANVEAIARLRQELPQRMRNSALMDAPRFTRNLEAQYRRAWRRYCGVPERP
jgi:predicted O-linked N-acetylglucosamine transferase (SPINDLY family)